MDRAEINTVLASAGLRPQHKYGQNFMVDQNVLRAIADAGHLTNRDVVLEVGPGVGNLTRLLAARAGAVLAVDIDTKLMPAAKKHLAQHANITWLNADVLAGKHEINPNVIQELIRLRTVHPDGGLKLVSNLPYNAASPLVAELLVMMHGRRGALVFESLVFTVQLEVALRMNAAPGTADYGPLGILIQLLADVEIVRKIPPGCFWPAPKVQSALVRVTPDEARFDALGDVAGLQRLLAGLFSHRRQKLSNGLKHYLGDRLPAGFIETLPERGIDATLRPESISAEQFLMLARRLGDRLD